MSLQLLGRSQEIKNNIELFKKKLIDEVWLFGDKISTGMKAEIKLAYKLGIPVYPISYDTLVHFNEIEYK